MIKCAKCGVTFRHKTTKHNKLWVCGTSNFKGKEYCQSKAIPESIINEIVANELGVEELTDSIVKERIESIVAYDNNEVVMHFKNGTQKNIKWTDRSRRNSWTPEMKEAARLRALKQHRKTGGKYWQ